jgi:hypothetical protein
MVQDCTHSPGYANLTPLKYKANDDYPGADPGFQVRGDALKNCWGISCEKSRFYRKKTYFFQF